MGTNCPRSMSYHKRLGVLFSQCHFLCPWNSQLWKVNTLQVVCYFTFFFFRKKAGSGTALSHHSKFLIFLLVPHFVLGLIGSTKKVQFGHCLPLPNLHLSATASACPTGTGEGSDRTEPGTQAPRLRNALLHLQPKLLTTFPNFCARPENTVLLFVC